MFYLLKIDSRIWVVSIASAVSLCSTSTLAQITPDGSTSTTVELEDGRSTINNGDRAGSNLFHSFQDFSVPNGNEAFFNNAADVANIFSRVTGGNISNIDGLIGANNANLFLINPAGIIFGAGARLDLGGGSFYGSTADSILFEEGEFSATDLDNPPLLTVNAPIGLNLREDSANIRVNSSRLELESGANLALVGGAISFDAANLTVLGGNIQLGGLSAAGKVDFTENLRLSFEDNAIKSDLSLTNRSEINVRGVNGSIAINANNLALSANSNLRAGISDNNSSEAQAGDINLNATELISLNDSSSLENNVGANALGNSGDINIQAGSLSLNNGSLLNTSILGEGNAGNINLNVEERITIAGSGFSETRQRILPSSAISQLGTGAIGNAGNIAITANSLFISDGAEINTSTFGNGDAGNIAINVANEVNLSGFVFNSDRTGILSTFIRSSVGTRATGNGGEISISSNSLALSNRAAITNSTFGDGDAGNIKLNVEDNINLERSSRIASNVNSPAFGNAGEIEVRAAGLTLDSGSQIGTSVIRAGVDSPGGVGNGGEITIEARDFVNLAGIGTEQLEIPDTANTVDNTTGLIPTAGFSSGLISDTELGAIGDAGNITVTTNRFSVADGAIVNALTSNQGRGGNITINAATFNATGGGQILTTTNSSGDAGTIQLNVDEQINISGRDPNFETRLNRANEFGALRGGRNIVGNQGAASGIFANTEENSTGEGGSIAIAVFKSEGNNLILDNTQFTERVTISGGARIAADSEGQGGGGSILIRAEDLILDNQAQILAETSFSQITEIIPSEINLSIANNLELRENSTVSAQAFTNANGGNININADFIIAFPSQIDGDGSDIIANAALGNGGNININAESLFGIQERPLSNLTNDINAGSKVSGLDGTVSVNTPDLNPVRGAIELPNNLVQPEQTITQTCQASRESTTKNSFTILGKGGIPPVPTYPLDSASISINGEIKKTEAVVPEPVKTSKGKIQPARGIKVSENGNVILTPYQTDHLGRQALSVNGSTNCGDVPPLSRDLT